MKATCLAYVSMLFFAASGPAFAVSADLGARNFANLIPYLSFPSEACRVTSDLRIDQAQPQSQITFSVASGGEAARFTTKATDDFDYSIDETTHLFTIKGFDLEIQADNGKVVKLTYNGKNCP